MTNTSDIVLVMLRVPNKGNPNEKRSDPFWEFGSFGCTGCHRTNILNPKRLAEMEGKRLAFAQGGSGGIRLVYLTPPVSGHHHQNGAELKWRPHQMPLKYNSAPIIINNAGHSDVPAVLEELADVNRRSLVAKFASKFRSRRQPLAVGFARQIEKVYVNFRKRKGALAERYEEALPFDPPAIDRKRARTYRAILADLNEGAPPFIRANCGRKQNVGTPERSGKSRCI